jgi:hypothetical protein
MVNENDSDSKKNEPHTRKESCPIFDALDSLATGAMGLTKVIGSAAGDVIDPKKGEKKPSNVGMFFFLPIYGAAYGLALLAWIYRSAFRLMSCKTKMIFSGTLVALAFAASAYTAYSDRADAEYWAKIEKMNKADEAELAANREAHEAKVAKRLDEIKAKGIAYDGVDEAGLERYCFDQQCKTYATYNTESGKADFYIEPIVYFHFKEYRDAYKDLSRRLDNYCKQNGITGFWESPVYFGKEMRDIHRADEVFRTAIPGDDWLDEYRMREKKLIETRNEIYSELRAEASETFTREVLEKKKG